MHGRWKENRFLKNNHQWTNHRTCWAAGQQHLDHWESSVLSSVHGTDIRCFRHLFSLNKWQYRDEYIKCCYRGTAVKKLQKKLRLKNCKKVAWVIQTCDCQFVRYDAGHAHHWTTGTPGHCCWPSLLNHNRCAYLLHCGGHDVMWRGQKIVRSRLYFPSARTEITLMIRSVYSYSAPLCTNRCDLFVRRVK